jgi:hypothetical protein
LNSQKFGNFGVLGVKTDPLDDLHFANLDGLPKVVNAKFSLLKLDSVSHGGQSKGLTAPQLLGVELMILGVKSPTELTHRVVSVRKKLFKINYLECGCSSMVEVRLPMKTGFLCQKPTPKPTPNKHLIGVVWRCTNVAAQISGKFDIQSPKAAQK